MAILTAYRSLERRTDELVAKDWDELPPETVEWLPALLPDAG